MYDDILDVELWAGQRPFAVQFKSKKCPAHLFVDGHEHEVAVCGYRGAIDPASLTTKDEYPLDWYCLACRRKLEVMRKLSDALGKFKAEGTLTVLRNEHYKVIYGKASEASAAKLRRARQALATLKSILDDTDGEDYK